MWIEQETIVGSRRITLQLLFLFSTGELTIRKMLVIMTMLTMITVINKIIMIIIIIVIMTIIMIIIMIRSAMENENT